ncbi:MAG TPA: hypothetical protein VGR32_01580 [Brevundimonas sp.]|jgi:hypothetical protein|uniref:hypothetical protein n=1 Tax=Brevundimonas sp. TaxID=1871086 RepID=UPI002DEDD2F8|nr:hypothetical protein [Brevundimonas sp.]
MTRSPIALAAALSTLTLAGAAAAQSTPDYTGDLNAMPARPASTAPAPVEAPQTRPAPAAVAPADAPVPAPTSASAPAPRPVMTPAASLPAAATPIPAPVATAPAAPRALTRAEIDALPFAVTLPEGYALTAGRPGPDFQVWTVRKGGVAQLMIYAGPSAQFPIHDGEMVEAGGRTTVVVVEDGRRRALEHLFRQSTAPNHIHVWIASVEGADRDRAEAIGHGVNPR